LDLKDEHFGQVQQESKVYMVVDCGGGTIDIACHEVQADDSIKNLVAATGGNWGSTEIDKGFDVLLDEVFGAATLRLYYAAYPDAHAILQYRFQKCKHAYNGSDASSAWLELPDTLQPFLQQNENKNRLSVGDKFTDRTRLKWDAQRGRLEVTSVVMRELFDKCIKPLIAKVRELLQRPELLRKGCVIYGVGGFSMSDYLRREMKKAFGTAVRFVSKPGHAVMIGAVLFASNPTKITGRCMSRTYGVEVSVPVEEKHRKDNRKVVAGPKWGLVDTFDCFVKAEQYVALGHKVKKTYSAAFWGQKSVSIRIFSHPDSTPPVYVDGCREEPSLAVDMPFNLEAHPDTRKVSCELEFGNTEIMVTAKDEASGKEVKCNLDFLTV